MAAQKTIIRGVVKDGVIIPEGDMTLPEGTRVEIALPPAALPPELQAEFAAWERASDDAWTMIEQWEHGRTG